MGKDQKQGLLASIKDAVANTVEAVRDTKVAQIAGKVWDGMQPAFEAGAHEAASLLYRGDAFVMYPRTAQGNEQESSAKESMTMNDLRAEAQEKTQQSERGMDGHSRDRDMGREL